MKKLTCEMCGGADLMKQEGVFVCQSCGTKYSVEDARRMMIEGPVEVKGKVAVDNTAKLDNLYKIARRARVDGNTAQAFKYYEQLQMEDPDNWESAFFIAYYQGINCLKNDNPGGSVRISGGQVHFSYNYRSGISPCIAAIHNCLDSVFSLIEDIEDYNEQQAAVEEVDSNVRVITQHLFSVIDNEYARMRGEISNYKSQIEHSFLDGMGMQGKNDKIRDSYKQDVSDIIDLVEKRKERLFKIVGKRRLDEYWDAHQTEKTNLESEKQSLNEQIAKLNKDINAIPGYTELIDSTKRLEQEKSNAMSSTAKPETGLLTFGMIAGIIGMLYAFINLNSGIFAAIIGLLSLVLTIIFATKRSKKNKSYQAEQANVESEYKKKFQSLNEKNSQVTSAVETIKKNIVALKERVESIDDELTKPR